jgi:hypothetical protein
MKDESRHCYSVPEDKNPREIYNYAVIHEDIKKTEVKKLLFFPDTKFSPEDYQYYFDEETGEIDFTDMSIINKIEEFRKYRGFLFKALDMEFMMALEKEDCSDCKEKIIKIKEYLRGATDKIEDFLEGKSAEEILTFNAFNNIFDIKLAYGGVGYTEVPTLTVSPPEESGFPLEATATVEDGRISNIIVTQIGSGYKTIPSVAVSKPNEPDGALAIAVASQPENDLTNVRSHITKK